MTTILLFIIIIPCRAVALLNAFLPSPRRALQVSPWHTNNFTGRCHYGDISPSIPLQKDITFSSRASRADSGSVFTFIRSLGRATPRSSLLDYACLDFFRNHQAQVSVGVQSSISYSAELTANISIDVVERGSTG